MHRFCGWIFCSWLLIWRYRYLRYTAGLREQQTEPCVPLERSEQDAACADSGSTWKNARTGLTGCENGTRRNGNFGCIGAVQTLILEKSMDGDVCWTISGYPGRMIRRNRTGK